MCRRRFPSSLPVRVSDSWPGAARRASGFTLIELVVVIAIIVVLIAVVVPGALSLWNGRKLASAETSLRGMLMTARARALRADGSESGLFFFVDADSGEQRIVAIERDREHADNVAWQNVFRITDDATQSLLNPIRVVPRYAVVSTTAANELYTFSEDELANDLFFDPIMPGNLAQRHRNFFAIVFDSDGQISVRQDVLIADPASGGLVDTNGDGMPDSLLGDRTGLRVGYDFAGDKPDVVQYYAQDDKATNIDPVSLGLGPEAIPYLVVDGANVAFDFPTVDGLLVYDDSLFREFEDSANKRDYLLRAAVPFYVNQATGAIVRGPLGENETP